jgi:hypothetical protein
VPPDAGHLRAAPHDVLAEMTVFVRTAAAAQAVLRTAETLANEPPSARGGHARVLRAVRKELPACTGAMVLLGAYAGVVPDGLVREMSGAAGLRSRAAPQQGRCEEKLRAALGPAARLGARGIVKRWCARTFDARGLAAAMRPGLVDAICGDVEAAFEAAAGEGDANAGDSNAPQPLAADLEGRAAAAVVEACGAMRDAVNERLAGDATRSVGAVRPEAVGATPLPLDWVWAASSQLLQQARARKRGDLSALPGSHALLDRVCREWPTAEMCFRGCCVAHLTPGCAAPDVEACVCAADAYCCGHAWDVRCVEQAAARGCGACHVQLAPSMSEEDVRLAPHHVGALSTIPVPLQGEEGED